MQQIKLFHHFALEMFDLKILQSDWPRVSWAISQKPEFLQV